MDVQIAPSVRGNPNVPLDVPHWDCVLAGEDGEVRFVASLDLAFMGRPTPEAGDVLDILSCDLRTVPHGRTDDDWLAEYGEDETDRLPAKRELERIRDDVLRVFGPEALEAIVARGREALDAEVALARA